MRSFENVAVLIADVLNFISISSVRAVTIYGTR